LFKSQGSSVDVMMGYRLDGRGTGFWFPAGARIFSLLCLLTVSCWCLVLELCLTFTYVLFQRIMVARAKASRFAQVQDLRQ
jgi:hypothetical protein